MARALLILLTLSCVACGDDFASVSELSGYRLLSIVADPEVAPDGTLTAEVVDYVAPEIEAAPAVWRVCPYSLGAGVEYACLVPETELTFETPTLSVDLATAAFGPHTGLVAALAPAVEEINAQTARFGAPAIDAQTLLLFGVDVVITVETGPTDARQRSVRLVRAVASQADRCATARQLGAFCDSGAAPAEAPCGSVDYQITAACETDANANPELALLEVVGLDGDGAAAPGAELVLKVTPAASARQAYYNDSPDIRCPDGDIDSGNDVYGGPCTEEIYYRWYSDVGALASTVTYESDTFVDRDSVLTIPSDAEGLVEVFVVAYDGRGGVSARHRSFPIAAD